MSIELPPQTKQIDNYKGVITQASMVLCKDNANGDTTLCYY